ncbi:MAG TPA: phosphatidate cytidylyltransferase [Thermoanaerobaculia bacterium]|nr:phosphatidate cytidylyltransferase [Thermoanaerobaculia bacterium]
MGIAAASAPWLERLRAALAAVIGRLAPAVAWAVGGILVLLLAASAAVWLLGRLRPQADWTELRQRVRTWWVMAGVFVLALGLSRRVSLLFFALTSFLALKEYLSLIPTRRADRTVLLWAYLTIPVQYMWIDQGWYGMFIIFIPVYAFLLLPMRMVLIGETSGFLRAAGTLHWGLMATVFALSHVAFLLVLPPALNPHGAGPGLVLYLVFLTQFNDVAQYLWGKTLGRHKVIPKVSPGKTVEGLLGGLATTVTLACLLAPRLTPLTGGEALAAGVLIGLGGFIGDVVISALKRDLGIKDSGTLLPGHGGILDRIDSLTYTAPLFFHFFWYLHGPLVTRIQ